MRKNHPLHYQSYLIRFWQEVEDGPWRATCENPFTREQKNFNNLDSLLDFLREQAAPRPPPQGVPPDSDS